MVKGREENTDVEEREKERERGSNLRRQRLASPTAQVLVAQTTQPVPAEPAEWSEWSERLTPGQSGWLGAAAVGSIPALALSLFLQHLEMVIISLLITCQRGKSRNRARCFEGTNVCEGDFNLQWNSVITYPQQKWKRKGTY